MWHSIWDDLFQEELFNNDNGLVQLEELKKISTSLNISFNEDFVLYDKVVSEYINEQFPETIFKAN